MKQISIALWSGQSNKGSVISGKTGREALLAVGIHPDFEAADVPPGVEIEYIHRRDGAAEIYFVGNRAKQAVSLRYTFRIIGKAPKLWDAVSGQRRFATAYQEAEGRTTLPLDLSPCGSMFVLFREPASAHPAQSERNDVRYVAVQKIAGPWKVSFDPQWGGPESVIFEKLESWTKRSEPGIKFYSGTATYRQTVDFPAAPRGHPLAIDLGDVRELAEVKLNGRSLGVVWAPPFRIELPQASLMPEDNLLELEVVNFWPNRVIGDHWLPPEKRLT